MKTPPHAIAAKVGDHDACGRIIARAFHDDPVNLWLFGAEAAMRPVFTTLARDTYLPSGFADFTDGEKGAALWLLDSNASDLGLVQTARLAAGIALRSGPGAVVRALALQGAFQRAHPHEPHAYLFAIGVVPEAQGQGVGGVLMRAGLKRVDAAGLPCYLESTKASNVPIYRHFGFEERPLLEVPRGCPSIYPMWRPAKVISSEMEHFMARKSR